MSEVIRIIAAVVDTHRLTMYREDGTTIQVPQGDARIRVLVEKVVPALEANQFCDLTDEDLAAVNHYSEAEKNLGGFAQFFRMFKKNMDEFMDRFADIAEGTQDAPLVAPVSVGLVPQTAAQAAVADVMKHAIPSSSPEFGSHQDEETTVVAVLSTGEMIPGMEKLSVQLQAIAAKLGSAQGVKNFLSRLASVKRNHSAQDLLTFMEKGELPIADDGSVLVYKRLDSTPTEGVFVDCHTGQVLQRVGSFVYMDEKLVDPNRSQDCSNGLHVARRDYLSGFNGDVCVLAKLAPEDVIAVPHSDPRKLRAKGYHIIAQLSDTDKRLVCSNKPMSDTVLLGNAVAGNHVGILEYVHIRGQRGTDVVITPASLSVEIKLEETKTAVSLDELPVQKKKSSSVNAAAVAKQVAEGRKSARQAKAEELLDTILSSENSNTRIVKAKELLLFKKTSKVSWDKLGITESLVASITSIANGVAAPVPTSRVVNGLGTPRERIRDLLDKGLTSAGGANAVLQIKKQAKKSWSALGVSYNEVQGITKLANSQS